MRVISLAGSPRIPSRSAALLSLSQNWLRQQGVEVTAYTLHDFDAEDLLYANFNSPAIKAFAEQLAQADGLLISTPVYKASFSGALKTLLDLLPERALDHKVVLPLATGGSVGHMLAVDYALKPVLAALKAQEVLHGVFADDSQIQLTGESATLTASDPDGVWTVIVTPDGQHWAGHRPDRITAAARAAAQTHAQLSV